MRMWVANLWDWLFRRSCWAESAAWAMGYEGCRPRCGSDCPEAALGRVGCWCGKFAAEGPRDDDGKTAPF